MRPTPLLTVAALLLAGCNNQPPCFDEPWSPCHEDWEEPVMLEPLPEAPPGCILLDPLEEELFYCPEPEIPVTKGV